MLVAELRKHQLKSTKEFFFLNITFNITIINVDRHFF